MQAYEKVTDSIGTGDGGVVDARFIEVIDTSVYTREDERGERVRRHKHPTY
jgi:hypothetical protein